MSYDNEVFLSVLFLYLVVASVVIWIVISSLRCQ